MQDCAFNSWGSTLSCGSEPKIAGLICLSHPISGTGAQQSPSLEAVQAQRYCTLHNLC